MNEIYIVDGQKYDVNPERKDEFLQKFPNAVLFEEPGKTTPTTPGAVVEDTAAPDIPNTELQSENTSLDLPDPEELTPEEKRNVPFGTAQYLHRNNKKFTKKNVEEAQAKLLADANKTFDERIEDLKNDILGNGIGKFKNLSYNLFGPDGFAKHLAQTLLLELLKCFFVEFMHFLFLRIRPKKLRRQRGPDG